MMKRWTCLLTAVALTASAALAADFNANCSGLPTAAQLKTQLVAAAQANNTALITAGLSVSTLAPDVGGIFQGSKMWAAVVNRDGEICAFATSTSDPTQVWPGSQAIAKAKAYTANAFSLDTFALSTARLYTFTQPGHSLWSLGGSNVFDPDFLAAPNGKDGGAKKIAGGQIFFGGGVPLYSPGTKIIGGLGVSGDTSCADHEIAKRVRFLLGMGPGTNDAFADDIKYSTDPLGPTVFDHPKCLNTYRNGVLIGEELPSSGY
jgi:uncharacterized protein GlcG (DUF336 family)